ncbi:MAG: excinuclease ABC subunit UvrC [Candidatus Eutrophobiaceae bacterium]
MNAERRDFLRSLPERPGVYRIFDSHGNLLYVGKARNLKKRVSSYYQDSASQAPKTRVMMSCAERVEITVTHTENEALILERNLIKECHPKYNIWFRDDKSYPWIRLSLHHAFPRFHYHRGNKDKRDRYFGPFPSAGAALSTLRLLQKLFRLRNCEDHVFAHRARPCLQHQIGRCSAPCVGYINEENYRSSIKYATLFLEGRNEDLLTVLEEPMREAAQKLDYETAAHYRDQIGNLRKVQEKQNVERVGGDVDIAACVIEEGQACVEAVSIRCGINLGSHAYFPEHVDASDSKADILSAWIAHSYLKADAILRWPKEIIVSDVPLDAEALEQALAERAGCQVRIRSQVRGQRAQWLAMAHENAELSLKRRLGRKHHQQQRIDDLRKRLGMEQLSRIECFDVSHTQGEATVASCVVFGKQGAIKPSYRSFNVRADTGGDDYLAMKETIDRRYRRSLKEKNPLPDLILIDGGKGQVRVAREALEDLGCGSIKVIGIAKGEGRKPGLEKLILACGAQRLELEPQSAAFNLMLQIRDEAHRFAISRHRKRRAHSRTSSSLERIVGIGAGRRQALLQHFGGLQGVMSAGVGDLVQVSSISLKLAHKIHEHFHNAES